MSEATGSFLPASEYRLLVECGPTMVWRSGVDARCDYFNETWLAFTGRAMAQEIGDGWVEGVHPDDLDACLRCYLEHFRRREQFEMQYRLRRRDGVYRSLIDWGVPYFDEQNRFAGFIGCCAEVKDRDRFDLAKMTFLTLIAHELRTPLASMRGFIEAIRRQAGHGRPAEEQVLSRLAVQVNRLAELVRDFLDIARGDERRELPLMLAETDLADLLLDTIRLVEDGITIRRAETHPIDLRLDPGPIVAQCDRARLEQAVLNLLDNAMKFSPDGSLIRVELHSTGNLRTISVSDAGIGVPPCDLPRLTERFFRAGNASIENFPGLGIGLSIVREIVERHGGALRVSSELGRGTTVCVQLPAPCVEAR